MTEQQDYDEMDDMTIGDLEVEPVENVPTGEEDEVDPDVAGGEWDGTDESEAEDYDGEDVEDDADQ